MLRAFFTRRALGSVMVLRRPAGRGFLDHDIFADPAGRLHFVLGWFQPVDRVIALLKYVPDPAGTWIQRETGQRYARSYRHQGIEAFTNGEAMALSQGDRELASWVVVDPVFTTTFLEVPRDKITTVFIPEECLAAIMNADPPASDPIEGVAARVAKGLLNGLPGGTLAPGDLGITGSVAWGGHSAHSDVNLNVYGRDACLAASKALAAIARDGGELAPGIKVVLKGFDDVPAVDASGVEEPGVLRRKPKVIVDGFPQGVQLRWCLRAGEEPLHHGEEAFVDAGMTTVTVEVTRADHAGFFPAVVDVRPAGDAGAGAGQPDVSRLLIYDTQLVRLFRRGDVATVTGLLQRVEPGGTWQLLLGSRQHPGMERVAFLATGD